MVKRMGYALLGIHQSFRRKVGTLVAPVDNVSSHDGVRVCAHGACCGVCCGGDRGFLCVLAFLKIINNYKLI